MTTSLEYPRCNPTALRVTTHVASGTINSSIDLKNLAEYMEISDDILYVEFKNETENIIKGVKTGKQSKKKKKGRFWNQITIVVRPEPGFQNNIKIFNNGSISMTGVKKIENGKISVQIIINKIKEIYKVYPKVVEDEFSIDTLCMKKFSIALINSDYNISYNINRSNLHKILNKQYNVFSTFDACEYPGVNVKMYWNKNNIEGTSFSGKCPCKVKCIGKGNGEGEGQCKVVTIFAFQSGSIMITGARCIEQIYSGYNFINSIFERHRDELEIKLPAFVINQQKNEKKEKKKKGIIYFHKDKVRNIEKYLEFIQQFKLTEEKEITAETVEPMEPMESAVKETETPVLILTS